MGLASGTGAVAHPSRGFYSRAAGAQRPWSGRPGCRRGSERPAMGAPVTPETCDGRPSRGRFVLCLKTPGSPHRWDDRSPGAVWSPAPMESVDRWPLASLLLQIPGGSRPAGAAVRRRVRGVWTLHPRAVCRSLPAPARAIPGRVYLRADRFLGGYSGGNWMVICVLPVRRGCRCGRALRVPLPE